MKKIFFVVATLALFVSFTRAERLREYLPRPYSYGFYAFGILDFHQANLSGPEVFGSCCPEFETDGGAGIEIGLVVEKNLDVNWDIGARFGLVVRGVEFLATETGAGTTVIVEGEPVYAVIDHSADVEFFEFGFEPYVRYNYYGSAFLIAGARVGYFASANFDRYEKLNWPKRIQFANGSRERNLGLNLEIEDLSALSVSVFAGLAYDFPLDIDENWFITPEFIYERSLTDVVSEQDWKINSIKLGATLKLKLRQKVETPPIPIDY